MAEGDRLHALDLAWLEMEGDGPPIAIGTVAVADGPAPSQEQVADLVAERASRMQRLHQALGPTGWRIRRPAWVDATDADGAAHVHRISAADARHRGLDAAVGWIMVQHLPHDRPLWDAWLVTDLDTGAGTGHGASEPWALVWRVHHSVADGVGALLLLGHCFDVQPGGGATLADRMLALSREPRVPSPDRGPATARTAGSGAAGPWPHLHLPQVSVPGVDGSHARVPRIGRALGAAGAAVGHLAAAAPALLPHPPGTLTGRVGERRVWVRRDIALDEVKAVRRRFGVSVNDVVLAGVAGGFRALLTWRGEPVDGRTVRNLVPVSLRAPGDDTAANRLGAILADLPVGVADPVQRLHRVAGEVRHARAAGEPLLAAAVLGLVDRTVPSALQDPAIATLGKLLPAWFIDTLTTNVPGPPFPVHVLGRRVDGLYPIIPVAGHTAITTGIFSYAGTLNVSVTGDADLAPDVAVLARGIVDAVGELLAQA